MTFLLPPGIKGLKSDNFASYFEDSIQRFAERLNNDTVTLEIEI